MNSMFKLLSLSISLEMIQCVSKKHFTLWNLNYLQAIVLIWQLWLLRINDLQKQIKISHTLEINNNVI